jgi:hypothetical protein
MNINDLEGLQKTIDEISDIKIRKIIIVLVAEIIDTKQEIENLRNTVGNINSRTAGMQRIG